MIWIFNSASIYIGTDRERLQVIRNYLDQEHISYKYKVRNRLGQWIGRGTLRSARGSLGNSAENMYEYEILVNKKDVQRINI